MSPRPTRLQRGTTLIQLLTGMAVSGVVMGLVLQGTMTLWRMQSFSLSMPAVQNDAQGMALRIADALRGADLCQTGDSSCTLDSAVESTSATGVTVYRRNDDGTLSELKYEVSGGSFKMSDGSTSTTYCSGANLALTYYSSSSYYSNGLTAYTPTSATTGNLAGVNIVATVTRDGVTGRYETFIRLRNSPKT